MSTKKSKKKAASQAEAMDEDAPGPSNQAKPQLPAHLQLQKDFTLCGPELNKYTTTATSANQYMALGVDNAWSLEEFEENLQIRLVSRDERDLEFDMINIDPAITNAFRRIMIAEVPTMAIEHVFFVDNTSIIADEVFAHRLGLVPLQADPTLFEYKSADGAATERNTIVLRLKVECRRKGDKILNEKVFSRQLEWLPAGSEMPDETLTRFAVGQQTLVPGGVAPTDADILLAKMRPGQRIELEAHCIKGIGREHAKWSPVATAWYRLKPEVALLKAPTAEQAQQLADDCPTVFRLEGAGASRRAVPRDLRGGELHLEKLRTMTGTEPWSQLVQVRKRKEHFIFTVQSTGVRPPDRIFLDAVEILAAKCDKLLERI